MSLDGITTRAIVKEMYSIIGSRINKINQPGQLDLVIITHRDKTRKLFISANNNNARIHFEDKTPKNPLTAPNFCMILRKH
ncbi:MAG: NFACT family protein, partial [Tissierellia bacterium]|nr:NFACT family protein [Tissierellia bacterium]